MSDSPQAHRACGKCAWSFTEDDNKLRCAKWSGVVTRNDWCYSYTIKEKTA